MESSATADGMFVKHKAVLGWIGGMASSLRRWLRVAQQNDSKRVLGRRERLPFAAHLRQKSSKQCQQSNLILDYG